MIFSSLPSILMIVAPLLIAAAGGMICERSGVVNIALEGLMGIGAFTAATVHYFMEAAGFGRWDLALALAAGSVVATAFTTIHAYASISLNADQTISGTGINLLSSGITIFFSQIFFHADRTMPFQMGMLPDATGFYPTLWIAAAVIASAWFVLYKTPFGLRLRACGEHPNAAASVGVNIFGMRYAATLASGFLAGLAGGCMVLTESIQFTSNTVNGTGFIALAAVAFGRWKPLGIVGSTFLFGLASALAVLAHDFFPRMAQFLPTEVFNIVPYAITLLALVIFSGRNYAPAADGKPYVTRGS